MRELIRTMYHPTYTISNKILKNIGIIEGCRQIIDHAPLLPYYEKKFQNEAMIRAVHHGTHIEGNELNLSQAKLVMSGEEVVARARDVQEVINYRRVMEFIGSNFGDSKLQIENTSDTPLKMKKKVDEDFILKLHEVTVGKILPQEKCGVYRKTQVVIKNNQTGQVTFTPPPASQVAGQIDDLIAFINESTEQDIHPILKSGIVHYEFVRIHPFVDGNGRVARALSTLILFQEAYDIRKFFSLEEYFDSDALEYYQALQSVETHEKDMTVWLEYFTHGLAIELSKVREKVERISVDGKLKEKLGGAPLLLSDRQLKLIEYIQQTTYLQNNAFKSVFPFVSEDTVLNDLKVLITAGIIKKVGKTKAAKYVMA